MKQVAFALLLVALLCSCGGGGGAPSNSVPTPVVPAATPPTLLSIEPDLNQSGQYLLSYLPGSMGLYGQLGVVYIPEVKYAGVDWYQPSEIIMGVFDRTVRLPVNLHSLPEGIEVSIRIRSGNISRPPDSGIVSNSQPLTLLPFSPQPTRLGFDDQTGLITWEIYNNSLLAHDFQFELSGLDAKGDPTGWQALHLHTIMQDPATLRPEDHLAFTEMPSEWENQPVLLRARATWGTLLSVPSPSNRVVMGPAIPTQFTATPGPSGVSLVWKSNTKSTSAELWIMRVPGLQDSPLGGGLLPIAKLPGTSTQFTDQLPLEGTYLYQLRLVDQGRSVYGPEVRVTTAGSLTLPPTTIAVRGYQLLLALPSGNILVGAGLSDPIVEYRPDGSVASTLQHPSMSAWDATKGATVDAAGYPHILYRAYIQGYVYQHAWKDADGWHEETLPPHPLIYDQPWLFCREPGQVWVVAPVSPTNTNPMACGLLRKAAGQWSSETISSPGTFIPTLYSTDQCLALHSDGTLSLSYSAGANQVLLQRHADGSVHEQQIPYISDPAFPTRSMSVKGLLAHPNGPLQILRLGGNHPVFQTFDGSQFSAPEDLPIPGSIINSYLDSRLVPTMSASGTRTSWVLNSTDYAFVCLRGDTGWRFNAIASGAPFGGALTGFRGETFWQCHLEPDPLRQGYRAVFEIEP